MSKQLKQFENMSLLILQGISQGIRNFSMKQGVKSSGSTALWSKLIPFLEEAVYLFSKEMKVCEAACLKISNDAAPTAFEMKRNILLTCCILLCDWQKKTKIPED